MQTHATQQDQQQGSIEEIGPLKDAHARLVAAEGKPVADAILEAAKALTGNEATQLGVLKDALRFFPSPSSQEVPAAPHGDEHDFTAICEVILVEKLALPGDSMTEDALNEAVMEALMCPSGIAARPERNESSMWTSPQTRRLIAEALDALTDEGLLARVETLVVLRPDAPPTERAGQPSYNGITPDDLRAVLNEELLAAGPGYSMDRGAAFSRTNHALNCLECAHDPTHLEGFAVVFDEAVDDLIEDGFLAQIVSYVRLPDAEECESVSA